MFASVRDKMSKFVGTVTFQDETGEKKEAIGGILRENEIIYYEDKILVTLKLFPNKIELRRKCEDYEITFPFEKELTTIGIYDIKCNGMKLEMSIETILLEVEDASISIQYRLLENKENIISYHLDYNQKK